MRPIPLDLGVAAIVLRDSKILLVQEARGPHEGQWGLPKGYVNPGELPASAVVRELNEECGIIGTVTGICGVRECVRNELARIFIAYHVQTSNQPLAIDVDEALSELGVELLLEHAVQRAEAGREALD